MEDHEIARVFGSNGRDKDVADAEPLGLRRSTRVKKPTILMGPNYVT